MTPHRSSAFATLTEIAKFHCQDDEKAAQLARVAADQVFLNPALIIGEDIMLSLDEFVGYLAQEMKRQAPADFS